MLISTDHLTADEADRLKSKGYTLEVGGDTGYVKVYKATPSETAQEAL